MKVFCFGGPLHLQEYHVADDIGVFHYPIVDPLARISKNISPMQLAAYHTYLRCGNGIFCDSSIPRWQLFSMLLDMIKLMADDVKQSRWVMSGRRANYSRLDIISEFAAMAEQASQENEHE